MIPTREGLLRILLKRDEILRRLIAEQRDDLVLAIHAKHGVKQEFEELCLLQKAYRENRDMIVIAGKM